MNPDHAPRLAVLLAALGCLAPLPARAQLVLNEICADNTAVTSPGGTTPDFVEIYNPGTSAVLLSGWSLSDTAIQPDKWKFPATASVPAKGHVVIWLDPATNYSGLVCTNFALRASGDELMLFRNLLLADFVRFGPQVEDLTLGRHPSGSAVWGLGVPTAGASNLVVSLGSPAALRINELMATNSAGDDWLELHNPATNGPVSLGGMVLVDVADVATAPAVWPNSFIGAGGFAVFQCSGSTNRGDRLDFKLSSTSGETVYLYAADRATLVDRLSFGPQNRDVSYGRLPDGGTNLFLFEPAGRGTPGAANDWLPLTNVVVNEILTHTDPPLEDAVELLNLGPGEADISGWWLSNSREDPLKFRIPEGTVIPAGGFKVFFEQVGSAAAGFNRSGTGERPDFTFNAAHGDEVVLTAGSRAVAVTGARSARSVPASANGVAFARHVKSTGGTDLAPENRRTFGQDSPATLAEFRQSQGAVNAPPVVGPVVFSEVMHHPPALISAGLTNDNVLEEFVELRNLSDQPVALYDLSNPENTWHVEGGIAYRFPTNFVLAPQTTLLLVSFDPQTNAAALAAFQARYGFSSGLTLLGPYAGRLGNISDSLELYQPDPPQLPPHPDAGFVPSILVEKVNYDLVGAWPPDAAGTGFSLQRANLAGYGNDPTNWIAASPTPGAGAPLILSPEIGVPPAGRVVQPGDPVTFEVGASGTAPLRYQWRLDGELLSGQTGTNLLILQAAATHSGAYDVVVANAAGTITSVVAQLTVTVPPRIAALSPGDATVFVAVEEGSGPVLEVLASTNLTNWELIGRSMQYPGSATIPDPAGRTGPWRYYRARIVP